MTTLIILHGSSAVGKTFLMSRIVQENTDFLGLEIDDCEYWSDYEPTLDQSTLKSLLPDITAPECQEFLRLYGQCQPERQRCVQFFVARLQDMAANPDTTSQTVIATCGALPAPGVSSEPSIYDWLAERLPITIHHVLIEIPPALHLERMKKRKRLHLKDEILENYSKKKLKRRNYDAVLADYDGLATFVSDPTGQKNRPKKSSVPKDLGSLVRVHVNTTKPLKYIQIFGERNSGTNHLKRLISEHIHEPMNVLGSWATETNPINSAKLFGYKHYYAQPKKLAQDQQHQTLFLVIYKNPYTWIRSTLAQPYHFKACLNGKTIPDLPGIRLKGVNVRGDPIPDVHPQTGEPVSIFQLRAHKIRDWESIAQQVDNVVYLNYEGLLLCPSRIIQRIVDNFGSLFAVKQVPEREADAKYVLKYTTPEPFSDLEIRTINSNIDWSAEARVGYRKDNFFIPT